MFRTVNHIHLQSKHPLFMFTRSPPTRRMDGDAAVPLVPYGQRSGCGGRAVWKYSACDYRRTARGIVSAGCRANKRIYVCKTKIPLCKTDEHNPPHCPNVGVSTYSIPPARRARTAAHTAQARTAASPSLRRPPYFYLIFEKLSSIVIADACTPKTA